ncbi:concanavalin A-like lectin/glucanase domain-containing protein [Diplogelasinospora grovesii]|uniref:Concanavalin A-like lectin/glucanase domain-containing protein n=1 Tax=Diplogelasinospora grovesii TaxID=303347 RepID=A0AAN6S2K1_9PEZI|nr:concanavalin A-like lectin/glucanase domain-containing protein [Diplogelasinospora grovesii]
MRFSLAAFLLPTLVSAWAPPSYSGYNLVWSDQFSGASGTSPNTGNWNIITGFLNVNAELETYTSSTNNVQISGGGTLQIVPWRDSTAQDGWTSGRLESTYTFTPGAGKKTMAEAEIRFGSNAVSTKQGIWPAFWILGDSIRHGTSWPECGELDILETVDGQLTGYGTVHCNVYPGGICNEPNGIQGSIGIPDQGWHYWRMVWDRTASSWESETITWYMDGQQFQQITGARIGDYTTWTSLMYSPLYFILNVAVGGSWPGNPNSATLDGYGAMMEVAYVAQYST